MHLNYRDGLRRRGWGSKLVGSCQEQEAFFCLRVGCKPTKLGDGLRRKEARATPRSIQHQQLEFLEQHLL